MTTPSGQSPAESCPVEGLLKILSGKWKPQVFRLATHGPLRFNRLLRQLPGANKQSVAAALKDLEEAGLLDRSVVREKPLHVEYRLSARGNALVEVFTSLETLM